MEPTPIVSPTNTQEMEAALKDLESLYLVQGTPEGETKSTLPIPPDPSLIGIGQDVYDQIALNLAAGKRHLMFYGPPGTGKTTLAQHIAGILNGTYQIITGSADWTSQDLIGGYQPTGGGGIRFAPGVLLDNFDQPLIIDELNRCDIDKAIGPLFTVLSGQPTTLPYSMEPLKPGSPRFVILPDFKAQPEPYEFSPTPAWRLLATINSIDKASLYQMSYALTRRFGWILVDIPSDVAAFIREYYEKKVPNAGPVATDAVSPIAMIWGAVNQARPMGPAPFIDMVRGCLAIDGKFDLFGPVTATAQQLYLNAFYSFLLPMLDGILSDQAIEMAKAVGAALDLPEDSATRRSLNTRLIEMAV